MTTLSRAELVAEVARLLGEGVDEVGIAARLGARVSTVERISDDFAEGRITSPSPAAPAPVETPAEAPAGTSRCGSIAGYSYHRRLGETVCPSCAAAWRAYQRERYRAKRGRAADESSSARARVRHERGIGWTVTCPRCARVVSVAETYAGAIAAVDRHASTHQGVPA